ncbi:MAG: hypothetical protein HZC28_06435 [Spirochaetes bacterium]|nr:hypothetical protein [Spirochaetota bacterium]
MVHLVDDNSIFFWCAFFFIGIFFSITFLSAQESPAIVAQDTQRRVTNSIREASVADESRNEHETSTNAQKSWAVSFEAGNGAIAGINGELRWGILGAGIAAGFDYSQEKIAENDYALIFISGSAFGIIHLLGESVFILDGRLRFGYNYLYVAGDSAVPSGGLEVTPEILIGAYNIYLMGSGSIIFSKRVNFIPQIGVGYRIRF